MTNREIEKLNWRGTYCASNSYHIYDLVVSQIKGRFFYYNFDALIGRPYWAELTTHEFICYLSVISKKPDEMLEELILTRAVKI
jgi:hypothetical protein